MKISSRSVQRLQLGIGLLLLTLCWLSHSIFVGFLAIIGVIFAVASLLTPMPEERVQKLQQQGIYPLEEGTDEDVRRVLQAGHKSSPSDFTAKYMVPLKEAADSVKRMV